MDINQVLNELRAERDRLNRIIETLENLQADAATETVPKRRGRKFMDKKGRKEVSERMKKYWANRRKQATDSRPTEGDSASVADSNKTDSEAGLSRSSAAA